MEPLNKPKILQDDPSIDSAELDEYDNLVAKHWSGRNLSTEETLRLTDLYKKLFEKKSAPTCDCVCHTEVSGFFHCFSPCKCENKYSK